MSINAFNGKNSKDNTNRDYKDRLFKFIFGNPENRSWTLSLYNAVNGSSYDNPDDIIYTTIEDAVYMKMKNDVSFLITDEMNFYEHQASFNPNMPMRFFIYAGMVYSKHIETSSEYHRYSSKLQKAPAPRCICFYNGTDEKEDRTVLRLSDAFGSESDIEVLVTMINVNYGHNKELLDACRPLKEYAFLIHRIRFHQKNTDTIEKAVDMALDDMPEDALIKPFLISNRAEVKLMFITEYDEERTIREFQDEGFEIGREKGREEGIEIGRKAGVEEGMLKTLETLINNGVISLDTAAQNVNMTAEDLRKSIESIAAENRNTAAE